MPGHVRALLPVTSALLTVYTLSALTQLKSGVPALSNSVDQVFL